MFFESSKSKMTVSRTAILVMIVLGAMFFITQDADAKKTKPAPTDLFACTIKHKVAGQEISVKRVFQRNGIEITNIEFETARNEQDDTHSKMKGRLFDLAKNLSKDLEEDCSPVESKDGHIVHRFNCNEIWTENTDHYSVERNGVNWRRETSDGLELQLHTRFYSDYDFSKTGFTSRLGGHPILWIEMPKPWGDRNRGVVRRDDGVDWSRREVGEVRIGKHVFREWASSNVALSIPWNLWPQLMQGKGDIHLTFYDTEHGVKLRKSLPRNIIVDIEKKLRAGYRRLVENELSPMAKCKLEKSVEGGPDIIVT